MQEICSSSRLIARPQMEVKTLFMILMGWRLGLYVMGSEWSVGGGPQNISLYYYSFFSVVVVALCNVRILLRDFISKFLFVIQLVSMNTEFGGFILKVRWKAMRERCDVFFRCLSLVFCVSYVVMFFFFFLQRWASLSCILNGCLVDIILHLALWGAYPMILHN